MRNLSFTFLALLFVFASEAQPLRVAVAANAQFVAVQLKEAFKKQTGINAELTVGSSGKLTAQIEQGAPFDVFLSADMKYPQELYAKSLTTQQPAIYAYGSLVLWSHHKRDLSNGVQAILQADVHKIAVANPKLAPYGEATLQVLDKLHLWKKAESRIVYGESISQVSQYLLSGAADMAFTSKSVVLDSAMRNTGSWVAIDSTLYQPIAQGIVIMKSSANLAAARQFYKFLLSPAAKAIFRKYGYH